MAQKTGRAPFLAYGRQQIDADDIAAVVRVLEGDWLTNGPDVEAFERDFAAVVSATHAVSCANGTAALHMAAYAARLGPDSSAIVPSITFLATANCARYVGAEVVFADVDPHSGLLTPETLESALARANQTGAPKPKAVLPVHLNGQTCDLVGIAEVAKRHDLVVIEDACHAVGTIGDGPGAERDPVGACRHSAMTVFSFHPVKTITTGEGGMVTTADDELAARLRRFRNHGLDRDPKSFTLREQGFGSDGEPNPWYYEMAEPGFNYRLTDIACALGISQLKKLPRFAATRRRLAGRYDQRLASLAPTLRTVPRNAWCDPALHLYVALIDYARTGMDRSAFMRKLKALGIGTQVHYLPVHRQPYYRDRYGTADLPGADAYYARCLSLPLQPGMTDADVDRVVDALKTVIASPS
ncbi:MAG TPA: UDP-4-amino-4,6-dideoxy-N-acetyl-beta-L-altrosamine transaminase [Magnetospirillaceae bacterium]|jgi:UDP-4-amino-4,6-dideoxy-N-acetyl-beta-L-altrosamine transaminase